MSSISSKKNTKLRKELEYWRSELEYIQEVLKDWHQIFEKYYREFCSKNKIDLVDLTNKNSERVESIFKPVFSGRDRSGTTVFKDRTDEKYFKKIYKKLAMKIHPDVGGDEKEFKKVTKALAEKKFDKLLDFCEEHNIYVEPDENINKVLSKQVDRVKKQIQKEKLSYSWKLYQCEDNEVCKEKLIRSFLKHIFNYDGKQ